MKTLLLASSLLFGGVFGAQQGVDVVRRYQANPEMVEEHAPLREYAASILEGVDLDTYSDAELEAFIIQLEALMIEKAAELGIELPEDFDFFQHINKRVVMQELMTYYRTLRAEIDWASLTPEERIIANENIKTLVQERALELGITQPIMGSQGARNHSRVPQPRGSRGRHASVTPTEPTVTIPTSSL
jgi:hypothetical protein